MAVPSYPPRAGMGIDGARLWQPGIRRDIFVLSFSPSRIIVALRLRND
jgi:hypothetical protein